MRITPQQGLTISIEDAGETISVPVSVPIPKDMNVDDPLVMQLVVNAVTATANRLLPLGFDQGVKRVASVVRNLTDTIDKA